MPCRTAVSDVPSTVARLDALELQAMEAELAQTLLDAVVIRHGEDIAALRRALAALAQRMDALASRDDGPGDNSGAGTDEAGASLGEALERERPPHY